MLARTTAHAGEAVLEDAAGEILLDHLGDDRPPVSVTVGEPLVVDRTELGEVILEQPIQRRRPGAARPVDSDSVCR